jgi:hypothetical protein
MFPSKRTNRAVVPILAGFAFFCVVTSMAWCMGPQSAKIDVDLYVVDHGHVKHVKDGIFEFKQLLVISEDALVSAKDMFRLSVLPEITEEVKANALSIEIVYKTPRTFTVAYSGRVVRVDRVLIPLSGAYAETSSGEVFVTVFYGLGGYSSGPYNNTREYHKRLMAVVEKVLRK